MTGACPGPMYALIGSGTTVMVLAVLAGVLGVYVYARVARQTSPLIHSVHEQLVDLAEAELRNKYTPATQFAVVSVVP